MVATYVGWSSTLSIDEAGRDLIGIGRELELKLVVSRNPLEHLRLRHPIGIDVMLNNGTPVSHTTTSRPRGRHRVVDQGRARDHVPTLIRKVRDMVAIAPERSTRVRMTQHGFESFERLSAGGATTRSSIRNGVGHSNC